MNVLSSSSVSLRKRKTHLPFNDLEFSIAIRGIALSEKKGKASLFNPLNVRGGPTENIPDLEISWIIRLLDIM